MAVKCGLLLLLLWPSFTLAKVVFAPFSADQRLINPAASVSRSLNGTAATVSQQQETTEALNLVNSRLDTKILIYAVDTHLNLRWHKIFAEFDLSYQSGQKTQTNIFQFESANDTSVIVNSLQLSPIQALVGYQLFSQTTLGLKALYSYAKLSTNSDYKFRFGTSTSDVVESSSLDAHFRIFSTGIIQKVYGPFSVSYTAEFLELNAIFKSQGVNVFTANDSVSTNTSNRDSDKLRTIRKDILGAGFLFGTPKQSAFKLEASYETMPPLNEGQGLSDGHLTRVISETMWSLFHVGIEYQNRRGYMIDPYNLIPYFFRFQEFSNDAKDEYTIFGGLRSGKGHSLSGFFTQSESTTQDKVSATSTELLQFRKRNQSFGLTYSYVF